MPIIVSVLIGVILLIVGVFIGFVYRKQVAEAQIGSAEDRAVKIVEDAKKEAEDIIKEAEQSASRIRVTKRISSNGPVFRVDSLSSDDKQALRTAHDIYAASLIYTDEMLTEVNDVVAQAYELINDQYSKMIQTLEQKARIISENKSELMSSLKELSKEERYAQILELSNLLSYELYNERMKVREMDKDVSNQMSLHLEHQKELIDDMEQSEV